MGKHLINQTLPPSVERVRLEGTFRAKYRVFAVILICSALLLAGFAVSTVAMQASGRDWDFLFGSLFEKSPSEAEGEANGDLNNEENTTQSPPISEVTPIPEGAVAVISKDLSYTDRGSTYLLNETPYTPDLSALLARELSTVSPTDEPLVLILHTHSREAYQPDGATYIEGAVGDATYSDDESKNMIAVGTVLARSLQAHGIGSVHCTAAHDSPTLGGAYDRSAETVKAYLAEYPSIRYVIDLHRDAVTTDGGEVVRAVCEIEGESVAQVMAVIGTDANGTDFAGWENNLAFALQMRELLNTESRELCRPIFLRNASFHQELAPCSILLEIGTSGNSLDEAKRAAKLVGDALADLIYE